MIRNLLTTYRPMVPSSLGGRVMSMLGTSLVSTLVLFSLSVFYFVNRTEGEAWQGRQTEAARNAAGTVAGFIQRVGDAMLVVSIVEPDHLVADSDELNTLIQKNPALLEIIRTDSSGHIFASASRDKSVLTNLITIPQSQWFLQAREGHTFLGDVQLSANNEPYLIMAVPSADKGVVAARVEMNVLWEVVKNIHFGKSGEVIVITYTGNIIAHTNPEFVISRQSLLGRPELSAMLSAPNHEWSGSYTNFHNQQVVAATQPVPGTDWIVITELPQSEAFASSRNAIIVLGLEAFLLMLVASLVMVRYVRLLIVSPISQLRNGADRIGQGDLNHRIGMIRNDEVGQLSSAFDMMAIKLEKGQSALKTLNMELENRVLARTADLQLVNMKLNAEIVEHKQSEDRLLEAEAKFRNLVEKVPAAVFIWELGENGACRYISPQIEGMLGFSVEEWTTDPQLWRRQLHPDDREHALFEDAKAIETGSIGAVEYRLIARNGQAVWIRDDAMVLPFEPGQPRLNFGVMSDITQQKQIEEKLRTSLNEKDVLLKEIHHRVKNNLQIISSLLNLQANQVKDSGILRALRDSQSRVRSMALIHEKLYQSKSLAKIDFGEYVQSLTTDLFRSYQRDLGIIQLKIHVDDIFLDLDQAVPCGLILNELITNTLKYAFPGGRNGTIWVELESHPGQMVSLKVADDGVGIAVDLDINEMKTLGWQLVNSLVAQIDGSLEVERSNGVSFRVSFNKSEEKDSNVKA